MNLPNKQNGQALMIVLLAVAAVAAVALTVSSRSSTEVSITTDVEDSQRAFSAAEAGVEQILFEGTSGTVGDTFVNSGSTYTATTEYIPPAATQTQFVYPFQVSAGESATLWLMGHDSTTNEPTCSGGSTSSTAGDVETCFTGSSVNVCWGTLNSGVRSAVEVSVYYRTPAGSRVKRVVFDPDSTRRASNSFSAPTSTNEGSGTCTVEGTNYPYMGTVNFSSMGISFSQLNTLRMLRVRSLYNTTPTNIGFISDTRLPIQGIKIDSRGTAGAATRRLNAFSLFPAIPDMFDAALYSPPGLTK